MSENDKSVEEYRRNIFILKARLAEEQEAVNKLKEEFSPYNLAEEESFTFKMKIRILELAIAELGTQERKHNKEKSSHLYALMFAVKKLLKSSQVLSVTPEMMFRGADLKMTGKVPYTVFENALKEVYRLPGDSISVIVEVLRTINLTSKNKGEKDDTQAKDVLTEECWEYLLECFLIKKQQRLSKSPPPHQDAYNKLVYLLHTNKILLDNFWPDDKLNMPEFVFELIAQLKELSYLEGIAVFSRFDPSHEGYVDKHDMVYKIQQKMQEIGRQDRFVLKK